MHRIFPPPRRILWVPCRWSCFHLQRSLTGFASNYCLTISEEIFWSQKLITHSSGTRKLWGTLCGPGHRIQRQRLQQQQQQRPSSWSSWQLWHSPRGPFHRGGSSRSPNRSITMTIMFTLFSYIQKSGNFVITNRACLWSWIILSIDNKTKSSLKPRAWV